MDSGYYLQNSTGCHIVFRKYRGRTAQNHQIYFSCQSKIHDYLSSVARAHNMIDANRVRLIHGREKAQPL